MMCIATQAQQTLVIGNYDERDYGRLEYLGGNTNCGLAVNISRYKMRAYKDCQIRAINIETYGTATGVLFISKGINDAPLYTQPFTTENGWNEVLLTTPYDIDGNELTFGYTLTTSSTGTLVIGDALITGSEYISMGDGWEKMTTASGHLSATLQGDNLPASEVALGNVSFPDYIKTGEQGLIRADIVNLGTDAVKSITSAVHIGDDVVTTTVNGLNIAPRRKSTISIPVTLTADGDYSLWTEVTEINGIKDAAPIDNASGKSTVYAREAFGQRNVLFEVFSTERCTGCPEGHRIIGGVLAGKSHVIEITHHAGFFTDKFTIPQSTEYEWFYKSHEYNTTFAPAFMTDRTTWTNYREYYPYGTPVAMKLDAYGLSTAYDEAISVPALATISINPQYDETTRALSIDIEASALIGGNGYDHPALNVFIVEDEVYSTTQENARGGYHHPHVVRQCLTPVWGEAFTAGGDIHTTLTTTLDEEWDAEKTTIVAFVANYNASSNSDCRVMNAEEVRLDGSSCGIAEHHSTTADDAIYDLHGRRINTPSKGIYIKGRKKIIK